MQREYDEFIEWKRDRHARRVADTQWKTEFAPLIEEDR